MQFKQSSKIEALPKYIFGIINDLKKDAYAKKLDVIDLGMGNPDMPTPPHIVERLCDTVLHHPNTHRYPQAKGMPKFRKAITDFYKNRFDINLDPNSEALVLIGSKEGIAHLCMSYLNPGDYALTTNPAYPVHLNGIFLSNGIVHSMPIGPDNNYLPDLQAIPEDVARKSKIMFLNYPNNPTAAVVEDIAFFKEVVRFAKKYEIIVCHDNAYSEIYYDNYCPLSFLQVDGAKDVGVEFHSLSKTYNMAGWRLGFLVGNADIIKPLEKLKSYLDYGAFTALQLAGVSALTESQQCVADIRHNYQLRRDKFITYLHKIGWDVPVPKATMYIWAPIPKAFLHLGSLEFASRLIKETGVAVTPGIGFGEHGDGFVRIALVTHINRFYDAHLRIKKFLDKGIS
ncbi:MAG: aminotransferase class I/II-fold pyridoxal phosphate-dependent enzyme [bacterium]|nr:aminotransferase class I/II-fold pyridoxal phosphate-dependent enzyme [bacterium]